MTALVQRCGAAEAMAYARRLWMCHTAFGGTHDAEAMAYARRLWMCHAAFGGTHDAEAMAYARRL